MRTESKKEKQIEGLFWQFRGLTCGNQGGEKKDKGNKVVDAYPNVSKLHVPPKEKGVIETISMTPNKALFGRLNPTHTPFDHNGAVNILARAMHTLATFVFRLYFIFIKIPDFPSSQLRYT